ncbi:MAG TPA: MFS transporter [Flavobacteriaceae bacterium]|nr:MFS transporter [Flavobacteriaceae bacterium]
MQKRTLTFWEIWNMSFGFLGIQFGFALQNANTSRIFETLGANIEDIPILWIAAPVTGLVVQPIIGYFSDRTWNKLGRRRPYFLVGAIFTSAALFLMPNSPTLWVAAGTLWLMDASINISMEPFRAFVGDNLPNRQRTLGFAMQSFFIGIGAVIGSALPYIFTNFLNLDNTAPAGIVPDSVKWSFYTGGIVLFLAVLWTVIKSKEYSPEELLHFENNDKQEQPKQIEPIDREKNIRKQFRTGILMTVFGAVFTFFIYEEALAKELYILFVGFIVAGILFMIAAELRKKGIKNGYTIVFSDMLNMPKTMKQLAWVQFFSWFALFSMWIYTTAAVTGHVFGTHDVTTELYNDAADWVTIMFGTYNGVAAAVAFLLPVLARKTSNKFTHLLALCFGGFGLISIYFLTDKTGLLLAMVGVGIAWGSILSIPYAMLSGSLPAAKMGYYMGVFNFFIVIPQIVAATILGFVVQNFFGNQPIYALIVGGVAMIVAGLLTLRVQTNKTLHIDEKH